MLQRLLPIKNHSINHAPGVTPPVRHLTPGYQWFFLEGARAPPPPPPPPPPPLHPLIAYSVNRYTSLWCFRYSLISVLIGKHNRYFFKFSFDWVHSLFTNLTGMISRVRRVEIKRRDGADAADGGRCEDAYVVIIPSPAATTIAARHRPPPLYYVRYDDSLRFWTWSRPTWSKRWSQRKFYLAEQTARLTDKNSPNFNRDMCNHETLTQVAVWKKNDRRRQWQRRHRFWKLFFYPHITDIGNPI